MLVLTRKPSQRIFIGDDVTLTVTRIGNGQVQIGIDAPPEVLIRRAELLGQWNAECAHEID